MRSPRASRIAPGPSDLIQMWVHRLCASLSEESMPMNRPAAARFVIDPPPLPVLPVAGTDSVFPVHRVYCVGRNYAAHAIEMGHDPAKAPPFFFQKNPDNLNLTG